MGSLDGGLLWDRSSKLCPYRTYIYLARYGFMANVTVTMGIEFWIVEICCILIAASCGRFCRVCWKKSHGLRGRNFNSVRS